MSWISLDDGILDHPKFIRAAKLGGSEAIHLWLGLRAYCARHLTDGFIPEDMLGDVRGPVPKARKRALGALLTVGLLDACVGGVALHDYLDWSRSRDDVIAKRDSARARQAKSRAGKAGKTEVSQRDTEEHDQAVTAEQTDLSQRDSRVTDASVTEPSPLLSSPCLTNPTKPHSPPEAVAVADVGTEPHRLRADFSATDDDWSLICAAGIPVPCQQVLTRWFIRYHFDGDSRPADEWRRSFRIWATKAWNTRRAECIAESKQDAEPTADDTGGLIDADELWRRQEAL